MLTKVLLLLAAAAAVWFVTRPRKPASPLAHKQKTDMVQCEKCGVYHAAADSCKCDK